MSDFKLQPWPFMLLVFGLIAHLTVPVLGVFGVDAQKLTLLSQILGTSLVMLGGLTHASPDVLINRWRDPVAKGCMLVGSVVQGLGLMLPKDDLGYAMAIHLAAVILQAVGSFFHTGVSQDAPEDKLLPIVLPTKTGAAILLALGLSLPAIVRADPMAPPNTTPTMGVPKPAPVDTSSVAQGELAISEALGIAVTQGFGVSVGVVGGAFRLSGVSDKNLSLGASAGVLYKFTAFERFPLQISLAAAAIESAAHPGFAAVLDLICYKSFGPMLGYQFFDSGNWVKPSWSEIFVGIAYAPLNSNW
jgi:hypothetical protein